MAEDKVQIKFGADAAELLSAMAQVRDTVASSLGAIGSQVSQTSEASRAGSAAIVNANRQVEATISSLKSKWISDFKAIQSSTSSTIGSISSIISKTTGLFAAAAAAAAGGSIFGPAISQSQRWTSEVVALSKALGITTERASGLNMALRLNALESGELIAMSNRMLMAVRSNGEELEQQGFRWRQAGNDQAAMFQMALRWIGEATSGVERNSRAQLVFARSAMEAEKYQKLTSQAIQEGTQRVEVHNLVIGRDSVEAYKAHNKQLNELKQDLNEVQIAIGKAVLPMFRALGAWLVGEGASSVRVFTSAIQTLGSAIGKVADLQEKWNRLQNLKLSKIWAEDLARTEAAADRAHRAISRVQLRPVPQPGTSQPEGDLTAYSVSDFDKTLQKIRNLQGNWFTWSSERELEIRKENYEWAVKYYGAESQVARDLWDRYADAARAANKEAHKGSGGAGAGTGSRDFRSESTVQAWRTELNKMVAASREAGQDTKAVEKQFWDSKLQAAQKGSKEYAFALQESNRLARELSQQEHKQREEIAKITEESERRHADATSDIEADRIRTMRQLGEISEADEIRALAQIEEQKYQMELQALRDRIAVRKLEPVEIERINAQIKAIEDRRNVAIAAATNKLRVEEDNRWKSMARSISSTLTNAVTAMLQGTQSLANGLKSIWNQIAAHIIGKIIETTVQFLANEIRKTVMAWAHEGSRTAAATAGAVARDGIQDASAVSSLAKQATTGIKAIFNDAKIAAANAYAWASSWGGPVAGAIAAAISFAAVMAFGTLTSAKGGLDRVPSDQLALVHTNEMILPAHLAQSIRDITNPGATIQTALTTSLKSLSSGLSGLGSYGIPADKLTFTRAVLSGGGPAFGAASAGAGAASRRGSSGDVTVNNPVFQFPSNLSDLVKKNPHALYRGVRDGVKRGHLNKRNFRR